MLAGWGAAVSLASRQLPEIMVARVLAVLGLVGIGLLAFLLGLCYVLSIRESSTA